MYIYVDILSIRKTLFEGLMKKNEFFALINCFTYFCFYEITKKV